MDNNTNDHDPEVPPSVSSEELEEALKWLEDLAGRSTAHPEAETPPPAMAADVSPFRDLIDNDEGDLPDWLHEAAPLPIEQPLTEEGEYESRLDWLAKMAERESIEELPTVEWRRISDHAQMTAAAETAEAEPPAEALDTEPLPPGYPGEPFPAEETPAEPMAAEVVWHVPEAAEEMPEAPGNEVPDWTPADVAATPPLEALATAPNEPVEPAADLSAAPISPETLLDSLPPDVELPPIDDLDATMAWIEEMAVSQETPIEDVPSVADRALASKLLLEAGLSPDALGLGGRGDELALGDLSLLEGNTPVNAFVAAEDFADTIVLVETMAADQGRTLEEPPEMAAPPAGEVPAAEETSFAGAMAFLDDLAVAQEPDAAITQPIAPIEPEIEVAPETHAAFAAEAMGRAEMAESERPEWLEETTHEPAMLPDELAAAPEEPAAAPLETALESAMVDEGAPPAEEPLSLEEAPWLEPAVEADIDAPSAAPALIITAGEAAPEAPRRVNGDHANGDYANGDYANGDHANGVRATTLEEALRAVDALALPPGTSLADVDASLRGSGQSPARRDLPAAVEWLEVALGISVATPAVAPSDEDLLARMPEDPDAVLAWLEQMAEEDTVGSSPSLTAEEAAHELAVAAAPPADQAPAERTTEPLIDELSEEDLLGMPEDPDAVIAWLEGLAGGTTAAGRPAVQPAPTTPPAVPDWPPAEQPGAEEAAMDMAADLAALAADTGLSAPGWPAETAVAEATPDEVAPMETTTATDSETIVAMGDTAAEETLPAAAAGVGPELATATGDHRVLSRPRHRGRRRGTEPTEPATVSPVDDQAAPPPGEAMATTPEPPAVDAAETPAPPETTPTEPAPTPKPASWVDLLKPLR